MKERTERLRRKDCDGKIFDKDEIAKRKKIKLVFCLFGPLKSKLFAGLNDKNMFRAYYLNNVYIYLCWCNIYIYIYIYITK